MSDDVMRKALILLAKAIRDRNNMSRTLECVVEMIEDGEATAAVALYEHEVGKLP